MKKEVKKPEPGALEVINDKVITEQVLKRIESFQSNGELVLPKDYSPGNALKSAFLELQEVKDRNNAPALTVCTKASVGSALMDMVVQGLNPVKKQCYFVVYGKQLKMVRSYMGAIAVAKRYGGVKKIKAFALFEGDEFEYELDLDTMTNRLISYKTDITHKDNPIVGAFALIEYEDGTRDLETMTMKQIQISWNKSKNKSQSTHKEFPEEMAKRTVLNRACKLIINTSSDNALMKDEFAPEDTHRETIKQDIETTDVETIDIEAEEVVEEDKQLEAPNQDDEFAGDLEKLNEEAKEDKQKGF